MGIILTLMGGLGFFLYGMKMMSDGLQKAAGSKMRNILELFTKNHFIGLLVGIFFTAIIQSSNATTVMVVSFVNSGLMRLSQAAGVIMGANIGTTVTGQLIAFNLSDAAPAFVMIGVIMVMFCGNKTISKFGDVVLGFGVLFMGMSTMSGALAVAKDMPQVVQVMGSLHNPLLAILVGFLVTAVLQSNSATVGIIMLLAADGLMDFHICFYVMMGSNMGCTMSAILASMNGKKDAKRAALIHLLFNICGTVVFTALFVFALDPISNWIMGISGGDISRAVANANTLMKVAQVVVMFPFIKWIVKATYLILPGEDKSSQEFQLEYIGKTVFSPTTAVLQVTRELESMGELAINNLARAMNTLVTMDEDEIQEVYHVEKEIDFRNQAITNYLVNINQTTLPIDDAKSIGGLFHVVNDIERIGDHAENVVEAAIQKRDHDLSFSKEALSDLSSMLDMVITITTYSIEMFSKNSQTHLQEILDLENHIDQMERDLQQKHIQRLTNGECSPEAGMIFSDIVSGLERVADHATNIAFSILEEEPEEDKRIVVSAS